MPASASDQSPALQSGNQPVTSSLLPHEDINTVSQYPSRMRGGGQDALSRESPCKNSHDGSSEEDKEDVEEKTREDDGKETMKSIQEKYDRPPDSPHDLIGKFVHRFMVSDAKCAEEAEEEAKAAHEFAKARPAEESEKEANRFEVKIRYIVEAHPSRRDSKLFPDENKENENFSSAEHHTKDHVPSTLPASVVNDAKANLLVISQEDPGAVAIATKLEEELVESTKNMALDEKKKNKIVGSKAANEESSKDASKYHSPSDSIMSPATLKLNELKSKRFMRSRDLGRTLFQDRTQQVKKDDDSAKSTDTSVVESKDIDGSTKE